MSRQEPSFTQPNTRVQAQDQYERNVFDDTDIGSADNTTTTFNDYQEDQHIHGQNVSQQHSFVRQPRSEDLESAEGEDEQSDEDWDARIEQYAQTHGRSINPEKGATMKRLMKENLKPDLSMLVNAVASYPPTSSGRPDNVEAGPEYQDDRRPLSRHGSGFDAEAYKPREIKASNRAKPVMGPPSPKYKEVQGSRPNYGRRNVENAQAPQYQGLTMHPVQNQHQETRERSFDRRNYFGERPNVASETTMTQTRRDIVEHSGPDLDVPHSSLSTNHHQRLAQDDSGKESYSQSIELDYDHDILKEKDLASLRAEPFDLDPRKVSRERVLAQDITNATLTNQVNAVFRLGVERQKEYFALLTIDEWEDAGDWFRDQFSAMLDRMKQARREKRKLAQSFEDEIERRHEAIAKRRRNTDAALADMRNSGMQVLQNTPKKKKQRPQK
ncbi:hypothetical protein MBLNU459_g1688t2 [Dothideomycetes sp. NU459]